MLVAEVLRDQGIQPTVRAYKHCWKYLSLPATSKFIPESVTAFPQHD